MWAVCYQELRVLREKRLLNTGNWEMRLPGIVAKVICTHSRPPHKNGFALIILSYIKIIELALNKFPAFEAQKGGRYQCFFQDIIGGYRGNFVW